jgi:acyl-CoA thioester hydrolase
MALGLVFRNNHGKQLSMSKKFSFSYKVTAANIDFNGHLGNMEYIKLGLKAAGDHWQFAAPSDQQEQCLWVVKRHEIDYLGEVFEGDELTVTTYIMETAKAISKRKIEIFCNEKLVCTMITDWYLLNALTKKPMRVTEEIAGIFL